LRAVASGNCPKAIRAPSDASALSAICMKKSWSGRRGSNPRPRPWQGRALPLSYTRIRDVGDRSPATAELCQMQAANATVRTRPRIIKNHRGNPFFLTKGCESARNNAETALFGRLAPPPGTRPRIPGQAAMVSRSDSSHFSNQPVRVPFNSSRRTGSQSNVAHHSTKARGGRRGFRPTRSPASWRAAPDRLNFVAKPPSSG
jgi:hypothetical protein